MGMNGTQIYQNFTKGDSSQLQAASDAIAELSRSYQDEAQQIKALQDKMAAYWTGGSGDAANAGANPLAQTFQASATPLDQTTGSLRTQSDVFQRSKTSVVPVPPAPEKPSGWSLGLKAAIPIVGPSMAVSDVNSYQEGVAKTNAANANNVRVMDQYTSVTGSTKTQIPMDYQPLSPDGASVGLKAKQVGTIGSVIDTYTDRTRASSSTGQQTVSGVLADRPVSAPPALSESNQVTSSRPTADGPVGTVRPGPNLPSVPSGTGPTTS
ncbi:WXG100 family type VII secretion target, partial [Amycolatopsis rhizosphaerae]